MFKLPSNLDFKKENCTLSQYSKGDFVKYFSIIPIIILLCSIFYTLSISFYKINETYKAISTLQQTYTQQIKDLQSEIESLKIFKAVVEYRLQHLEKEYKSQNTTN